MTAFVSEHVAIDWAFKMAQGKEPHNYGLDYSRRPTGLRTAADPMNV